METLNLLLALGLASGIAVVIYKYIISRQRLPYDKKINMELILSGFLLNFILRFALIGTNITLTYFNIQLLGGYATDLANGIYTVIFIGMIVGLIHKKVMKPIHYVNRFDIVIYCLCVAIGIDISSVILVSIFGEGIHSLVFIFSSIIGPLSYMMVMATFLIRMAEGKKIALIYSILFPIIIVFLNAQLFVSGSIFGIVSSFVFDLFLLMVFFILFITAVRSNVQIDGINVEEQLERFENEKTLREKLSYRFDIFMSHGKLAMTGILLLVGFIVIVTVSMILLVETPEITGGSISKTLWLSFMRVLDPGNVATDPEYNNSKFVLITTLATFIGLGIIATYIGIVSGDFSARIEKLREGNSKVLEKNHILFIGFCEDTLSIIDNIIKFQSLKNKLDIVIVSNQSRKTIEDQIASYGLNLNKNRIICRSGQLESRNTLVNMGITRASKVIIVGDEKHETTKIAMTVNSILKTKRYDHIDIQLMADRKSELTFIKEVFGGRMHVYSRQELDLEPIVRATQLKEYLKLYGVLIGVDGELIVRLVRVKKTIGKNFGSLVNGFKYSTLIGLEKEGEIILNPDKSTLITKDHQLIMLVSSHSDADFIRRDRRFNLEHIKNRKTTKFVDESVMSILMIGEQHRQVLSEALTGKSPSLLQYKIDLSDSGSLYVEIDKMMTNHSPDMVVMMGSEELTESENDDLCLNVLAYLDAKYNRKRENYVVSALIHSVQDIKFAHELDYIDMAIESDKCRRMALQILDENNMIMQVEETLFEAGNRVGAVLAADIVGTAPKEVSVISRDCLEHDLILIGYITREGGLMQVEINPNKNDRVCFDDDDLLLVIN